jgi:hypothetical protein
MSAEVIQLPARPRQGENGELEHLANVVRVTTDGWTELHGGVWWTHDKWRHFKGRLRPADLFPGRAMSPDDELEFSWKGADLVVEIHKKGGTFTRRWRVDGSSWIDGGTFSKLSGAKNGFRKRAGKARREWLQYQRERCAKDAGISLDEYERRFKAAQKALREHNRALDKGAPSYREVEEQKEKILQLAGLSAERVGEMRSDLLRDHGLDDEGIYRQEQEVLTRYELDEDACWERHEKRYEGTVFERWKERTRELQRKFGDYNEARKRAAQDFPELWEEES